MPQKELLPLIQAFETALGSDSPLLSDKCMSLIAKISVHCADKRSSVIPATPQLVRVLEMARLRVKDFPKELMKRFVSDIQAIESSISDDPSRGRPKRKTRNMDTTPSSASSKTQKTTRNSSTSKVSNEISLPKTVAEYSSRLTQHHKELYKTPPVLPPPTIEIYEISSGIPPKRNKAGRLCFSSSYDAELVKLFRPNRSPEQVLRGGAFGGTYFRSIHSAVTNQNYNGSQVVRATLPESWRQGIKESRCLTNPNYDASVNKFGAKCGGSLGMWESSGWIADVDPYGWFQWYCRFYQGRRTSDDARQIQRWMGVAGPKGRFKSQLCNKIIAADTHVGDTSISPVIRQTMWHWGLEITDDILEEHRARRK